MLKNIYIMIIFTLSIIAISYGATDTSDTSAKVDSTIILYADFNGDKKEDSIFCHVTGKSWNKPITVAYKILCNNSVILSESSSDEALDQEFGNPDMMDWCKGYVPCKKEWYFKRLPKGVVKVFEIGNKKRKNLLDTTSEMSIPSLTQKFYRDSLGYSKKKAKIEAKKLVAFFKKRDIVFIVIPGNPIYKSFPRLYDPLKKKFIQFFGY